MAATDHLGGQFTLYHGTRASLAPGDMLTPGRNSNHEGRTLDAASEHVYGTTSTAQAGVMGAASGKRKDGPVRVYHVEPTGPLEDDPEGNGTLPWYRSKSPMRVVGEV